MGHFFQTLERILGNKQDAKQTKSLKSRSPQLETLEDRMLLSVTAGDLSHPAVVAPVPGDQTDDALVVLPTSAQTITVKDETELKDALSSAKTGDIIYLIADIDLKDTMTVTSEKNITLDLHGYTLKALAGEDEPFSVITNAGILTITDSSKTESSEGTGTITGGTGTSSDLDSYGGGIYNTGTLTIDGGTIKGNSAQYNGGGGGIYNTGTLTIDGGTITENSAENGGGIYIADTGTLTINSGTIKGNSAVNGGGIYNNNTLIINDGTIKGNSATADGGGIVNDKILLINGGTITENSVEAGTGGGICNNNDGTLTMNGGTITGNLVTGFMVSGGGIFNNGKLTINRGKITGNSAAEFGGGISNYGTLTLGGDADITGNTANSKENNVFLGEKQGGSVRQITISTEIPLKEGASFSVTLETGTGTFAVNAKESDQAYFTLDSDPADKTITYDAVNQTLNAVNLWKVGNETELNNAISNAGKGDVIQLTNTIDLTASMTVPGGKEFTLDLAGYKLARLTSAATTFSVITNAGTLTITDSSKTESSEGTGTITGGTGTEMAPSFVCGGGILNYNAGILTINGGTITGNSAGYYGGGIYNLGKLTINGGKITKNSTSTHGGGGINNNSGTLIINGGTIAENSAGSYGGGIYNSSGTLTINDGMITKNSAATYGGGIYNYDKLTIKGGTITENLAVSYGGGICHDGAGTLTLGGDADITGNTVNSEENNVYLPTGKTITISEETPLKGGAAFGVTLQDGKGTFAAGAKESDQAYFTLDGNPADKLITYDAGNQFLKESQVWTVTSDADTNDEGTLRNALTNALDGDIIQFADNVKTITLSSLLFINKAVTINGGSDGNFVTLDGDSKDQIMKIASVTNASGVKINNVKFVNGMADNGGALKVDGEQDSPIPLVALTNCVFQNNTSTSTGAVFFSFCSNAEISNCLFTGNSAAGNYGSNGAVAVSTSTATFNNCTLTNNSTSAESGIAAGAISAYSASSVTLNNSIVVNNTGSSTEINLDDTSMFTCNNVLGGTTKWPKSISQLGCIEYKSSEQLFVSTAAGSEDYHIVYGSQAQDAGNSTLVPETLTTDLDGNPRISGDAVDLGCYEIVVVAVTNTNDVKSGEEGYEGSLRWALEQDNNAIVFDKSLSGKTITLAGELVIKKEVTIDASSLEKGITISGAPIKADSADCKLNIIGVTIADVETDNYVFLVNYACNVTLTNCVIKDCTCDTAIWVMNSSAQLTMVNCLVANNTLTDGNSAVRVNNSCTLTMTNCTIAGNTGNGDCYGLGIYSNGTANLYNCIVAGNKNDVTIYNGTANAYNTLSSFENWTAGEENITYNTGDKLFVDAANGDYHLITDSVAKDKGKNGYWTESSTKDLDGYKRVMYSIIDMGAYEYQYTITPCNCTFDGNEHAAFTIEKLEAGATASCIVDGTSPKEIPSFRAAGSHNLIVTIKREGYKDYVWNGTSNIERAAVTISDVDAQDKTYDAKTAAVVKYEPSGIIEGTIAVLSYTADFKDKNAGEGKTVDITFEIKGNDSSNYKIVVEGKSYKPKKDEPWIVTTTDTADIFKAKLAVQNTTVSGKTYDGTKSVAVSDIHKGTLQGIQGTDEVSIDSASGTYDDANAGSRTVTVNYTLKGDDANNYTVGNTKHQVTISQRPLTVDGTTVNSKNYDGTTDATVNRGTLNLSNIVSGDTAEITSCTGTFADQWPGKDKDVTVSYTLDNANYYVADETKKADITLSLEVTTLADTVDPDDGVISLREAMTYANDIWEQYTKEGWPLPEAAETVTFAEGLKGTITLTSSLPEIKFAYDIDGDKRITIDGGGAYSIFKVAGVSEEQKTGTQSNPVVLTGLTLTGGKDTNGAAVNAVYSYVTVKDSILVNNTATQNGGAIYVSGSTIAVTNSTINGNTASSGGAAYFGNNTKMVLVNNTIVGNTAASGAALFATLEASTKTYNNLIISNGTSAADQLSGITLTSNGCNYMTMDASLVFKTALPTTSAGYLDWIPALKGNKSVINAGSMSDTVKGAFGVKNDDWTGIKDNYGNDRVTITSNPATTVIDIGSYEAGQLDTPENVVTSASENTITVTWDAVEDADNYTLEYQRYDAGAETWTAVTGIKKTTYTIRNLEYGMKYNIRVKAVDSTESRLPSDYSETVYEITDLDNWDLTRYSGYSFKIDTYTDEGDNLHLALYSSAGQKLRDDFTKSGRDVSISGNTAARNVTIGSGAMQNLGTITYTGTRDTIQIEGSDGDDRYTIDQKTAATGTEIPNPYAATLANLERLYRQGILPKATFETLKATYDRVYEQYKAALKGSTTSYSETIALNQGTNTQGAKLVLSGVNDVVIDAKAGDDAFIINQYGTAYKLIGGSGSDTIDFSNTGRVVLNMGTTGKQFAVAGQIGSITLNLDTERLIGSQFNDVITSAANTTYINGNGGTDVVNLRGTWGTSTAVDLNGNNQTVVATGAGNFTVTIANGTGSRVNAAGVQFGSLTLTANGDRITALGTGGSDTIAITGSTATIYGYSGDDTIDFTGANAVIFGGLGNDTIRLSGSGTNFVYGEAGNDFINLSKTYGINYAYAGSGDDTIIGGQGRDYQYAQQGDNVLIGSNGADNLIGGTGRDLLIANTTKLMEERIGESETEEAFYRDLAAKWSAGGTADAITNLIGKESIADGARDVLTRGGGFNNMIYSNGWTDGDIVSAIFSDVVFSDVKDGDK